MDFNGDAQDSVSAQMVMGGGVAEQMAAPRFRYDLECRDADGNLKWTDTFWNTVTTQGKNDLLDKYFAGSAYTAAWYLGLISSVSYSAIAAADTAAQINGTNGWKEADGTSAPNYAAANRSTITFAAASSGSKASSAITAFTFSGGGTVKGAFVSSAQTKSATTGVLYSAGLLSGGDRIVLTNDVLTISLTVAV